MITTEQLVNAVSLQFCFFLVQIWLHYHLKKKKKKI